MPEFREHHDDVNATRASARLPGLDIEIVHRRAAAGDAEQISINLTAAPSFEAFGRALEAANPLVFWAQSAQLALLPWLGAARALILPWTPALPRPSDEAASPSEQEPASPR